jgi:hypothetical protein
MSEGPDDLRVMSKSRCVLGSSAWAAKVHVNGGLGRLVVRSGPKRFGTVCARFDDNSDDKEPAVGLVQEDPLELGGRAPPGPRRSRLQQTRLRQRQPNRHRLRIAGRSTRSSGPEHLSIDTYVVDRDRGGSQGHEF